MKGALSLKDLKTEVMMANVTYRGANSVNVRVRARGHKEQKISRKDFDKLLEYGEIRFKAPERRI